MAYLYENKTDRKGNPYVEITGYEGAIRHLSVPGQMDGTIVRSIGSSAFAGRKDLISVSLPDTIDTLGRYAFYNCANLREICLYDGVEDYYDGVIKQCQSLSEITLYQERERFSVMKELLADNDRRLRFQVKPSGLRLTFPAYVYDFVEDVEARVLHHKIEGSGYPYRECVTRKGIDLLNYDRLFSQAVSDDYEAAIMIATDRLLAPIELEPEARERYEQYLEQNAGIVLQKLMVWDAIEEIRYLCENCLIPKEALEAGLYEAAGQKKSAITAVLMEYQRKHFAGHQQATKMTLDDW